MRNRRDEEDRIARAGRDRSGGCAAPTRAGGAGEGGRGGGEGLLALSVRVGLGVLAELMEEEVDEVVGPKGRHDPALRPRLPVRTPPRAQGFGPAAPLMRRRSALARRSG